VDYDPAVVAEVVQKYFPDWRRVLNELQRYSATGKIDSGILANLQEISLKELINLIKDKNFTEVRKWVAENGSDNNTIYRKLYDTCADYFTPRYIPQLILTISQYQYQSAFSADQEINLSACLADIMTNCEFK
jgi:replication factor C small subunit/replication factor C subunit 2/4